MSQQPQLPPNFRDTVEDTGVLLNALIDRIAQVAGNAGTLWMTGGFVEDDVKAVSEDIGDKLTAQALEAWDVAEKDVNPFKPGGTNG
jgi:hypothetical protein